MRSPGSPDYSEDWLLKKNLARDLTEQEQLLLSEYITDNGTPISLGRMLMYVRIYMSQHGHYPTDATDVVRSSGFLKHGMESDLDSLSESELLEYYNFAINPLTGRLYDSFDNEEWVPLGILIKPITGEGGIKMIPGPVAGSDPNHPEMEMQPMRTWLIQVYGETPGKILLQGNIWTDARDENDRWWK